MGISMALFGKQLIEHYQNKLQEVLEECDLEVE